MRSVLREENLGGMSLWGTQSDIGGWPSGPFFKNKFPRENVQGLRKGTLSLQVPGETQQKWSQHLLTGVGLPPHPVPAVPSSLIRGGFFLVNHVFPQVPSSRKAEGTVWAMV